MSTATEAAAPERAGDLVVELAEFAAGLEVSALPRPVVEAAKRNILDTMACALAGSSAPAISTVVDLVGEWGGTGQAEMWVFGGRYPAHHAAWANAAMAHARDYDDTHDAAILHAGVSVVPAAVAAGSLRPDFGGRDLVAAVAAGLEVMCRLGTAVQVDIIESGFIYSSLLGYFGATAAAGRALGLSCEEMVDALGVVYSSVAGNHQVTRDASLMKRLQPALAAQAAVVAAQLAQRGIRGPRGVFEGLDGFFRVYLQDKVDAAVVRKDLGARFEFLNLSYKPYPCCRDTHAAVEAALQLRARTGRGAADVESIRVGVTAPGYQMVCVPEDVRRSPTTIVEAQFSIPYAVAAAWTDATLGMSHFTPDGITRPEILELAGRVHPYVDADIDRDWHRFVTPAAVTVTFRDGSCEHTQVDYAKGHPHNPMSREEFAAKSADCATYAAVPLPDDVAHRLAELVEGLEELDDVRTLVRGLAPAS